MARIIAIDYGLKRTGIAVTDPLQIIATGLDTVETQLLIPFLQKYIASEEVEAIVLGYPTRLDDTDTHITPKVREVHEQLKKLFPQTAIHLVDERYTSKMAFDAMIAGGLKKQARQNKQTIDKVSATIILQSFLESYTR